MEDEPKRRSDTWAKWALAVILALAAIGLGATVATNVLDRSEDNACEDLAEEFGRPIGDC